ncbi:hypothetical protein D3C86_730420 [compost metagenome]
MSCIRATSFRLNINSYKLLLFQKNKMPCLSVTSLVDLLGSNPKVTYQLLLLKKECRQEMVPSFQRNLNHS